MTSLEDNRVSYPPHWGMFQSPCDALAAETHTSIQYCMYSRRYRINRAGDVWLICSHGRCRSLRHNPMIDWILHLRRSLQPRAQTISRTHCMVSIGRINPNLQGFPLSCIFAFVPPVNCFRDLRQVRRVGVRLVTASNVCPDQSDGPSASFSLMTSE